MSTLSNAIAAEFERILKDRGLTVRAAARELRVSRQAFHNYLNGKSVPRHKTLGLAMDRWNFELKIGDITFDRSSFPKQAEKVSSQEQLPLTWENLDAISQQDLKIAVVRVGSTLNIDVRIDIPA
jgi:transcriptional regulator with XRE-family HTH domain